MSDLDDYTALFDRTRVKYERVEHDDGRMSLEVHAVVEGDPHGRTPKGAPLRGFVPSGPQTHVNDGYQGFVALLAFSAEGELQVFGVWE